MVATLKSRMQDPFNVTQTWLHLMGFEYDELIVVDSPESKARWLLRSWVSFATKSFCFIPFQQGILHLFPALFNAQVAHLSGDSILVDDFTLGHEKEEPSINAWFMDQLAAARNLSFQVVVLIVWKSSMSFFWKLGRT